MEGGTGAGRPRTLVAAARRGWLVIPAFALLVAAEWGVEKWVRWHGVHVTGDEPHYLTTARALAHFSFQLKASYHQFLQQGHLSHLPRGAGFGHVYMGPHGPVSIHGIGLSLLVMPFVAAGGTPLAYVGLFALEAAGLVYLHQRASRLVNLGLGARALFALMLASPAILVAGTQLYPDLPTGILLAGALLELAVMERSGRLGRGAACVLAVTLGILPWLHDKNLMPSAVVLGAFGVIAWRQRMWRPVVALSALVVLASWSLHLVYNLYYFGHLLGYPQPPLSFGREAAAMGLGLLFDRDQGLFVQVPVALAGVIGMLVAFRRVTVAVSATVVSALAVLIVNAGFVGNPYGGLSLAGRFEWTMVPMILVWCAPALRRLETRAGRILPVALAVCLLDAAEIIPIARNDHSYYNVGIRSWDPAAYPGWWPGLHVGMPAATMGSGVLGTPWYGSVIEMAMALLILVALIRATRPGPVRLGWSAGVGVTLGCLGTVLALANPLPATPLRVPVAQLTTPTKLSLGPVGPGLFDATLVYRNGSTSTATLTMWCGSAVYSATLRESGSNGPPAQVGFHLGCRRATLWVRLTGQAGAQVRPQTFVERKLSS